ncbi:MAG: T9SS type A sorting domain-containing protein [Bacteroidales bacterium]|jgi:hypothetical protein|nr:T9SS type A sorting domain-containing protein [Bacteroidales bacterium]
MKKLLSLFMLCMGAIALCAQSSNPNPNCVISSNTVITAGEEWNCTSLKINPGFTLTVQGTLRLPEGFTMSSGTLIIEPAGIVHIMGEFNLTTEPTLNGKVEVINNGVLELWGTGTKGKFEMRPKMVNKSNGNAADAPHSAANSLYFTNNGTFNIKDCEFIVGKGANESGGAFFYNENDALIYIDNKNYPSREVYIGGKQGLTDDVSIGIEKINSSSSKKHAKDQQAAGANYAQNQFFMFMNEGSKFVVKNTDANWVLTQQANDKQSVWGEFYVYDGDLTVNTDGGGSGGQRPVIPEGGGIYVYDTTPSDGDQKGVLHMNAGGGDTQWDIWGNMWCTGLEMGNSASSGANQINVKGGERDSNGKCPAGGTVFIGNVGANVPSENYKVHVESCGELFYCGNYSGGGDMIGWVDAGGSLYYAQGYYDWDWHNTDEQNPNKESGVNTGSLVLYNGPLMGEWRINADSTELYNTKTGEKMYLKDENGAPTSYFEVTQNPNNYGVEVNIYTPQGAGHQAIAEYCIVDSPWYISGTTLTNGSTMYSNVQSGTSPYYVKNTTTGKAEIYTWKPEGYSQTNVDIVVSDYTMTNNILKNNVTGETWSAYANDQTSYYRTKPDGKVEVFDVIATQTATPYSVTATGKWKLNNWGVDVLVYEEYSIAEPKLGGTGLQIEACPSYRNGGGDYCFEKNGNNYTFKHKTDGQVLNAPSTTYSFAPARTVSLATDWQIVNGVLTKTSSGETYQTDANKPTTTSNYYATHTAPDGKTTATIYTYKPAQYEKTKEQDIRSDWQIVGGKLKNTEGSEEYSTYVNGSKADYYSVVNSGPGAACNKTATVYQYSEISYKRETVLVVTSGWYFDGTTLKNENPLNILFFDNIKGIPQEGQKEIVRDYHNQTGHQSSKTVLRYEKYIDANGMEKVRVLSDIDDFYAFPNSTVDNMAQWGVYTSQECENKFLNDNVPPPHKGFYPVSLTYFTAVAQSGGGARVQWATQSETNNDYFTLYRSYDGVVFHAIATFSGAGTTTAPQKYSFGDNAIIPNIAYYRLGQTDYNGTETLSRVVAVRATNLPTFEIETVHNAGNSTHALTFLFPDSEGENVVTVYNVLGVQAAQYRIPAGSMVATVQLHAASGAYIVEHTCGARKSVKKIVVK